MDVMEMSFLSPDSLIIAASEHAAAPQLFLVGAGQGARSLGSFAARYPAVSPDKLWLAFSRREGGHWNLWVEDLRNGSMHRVTDLDCNDTSPGWESNSTTVIYASDCGRAFGLSALQKLQIVP
jgi:Tol biopolymer transport system component